MYNLTSHRKIQSNNYLLLTKIIFSLYLVDIFYVIAFIYISPQMSPRSNHIVRSCRHPSIRLVSWEFQPSPILTTSTLVHPSKKPNEQLNSPNLFSPPSLSSPTFFCSHPRQHGSWHLFFCSGNPSFVKFIDLRNSSRFSTWQWVNIPQQLGKVVF